MSADTPAYEADNIFAKILRGEIPCHKVYEDENAICFMDVMPQSPGHALVVPKAPSRNLIDADPAVLKAIVPLVQKVAQASMKAFSADGISVLQYNEEAGGQTVFHLHVHIIPRYDGKPMERHSDEMEDGDVLAENAAKLKAALEAS